jgi:hypothetical protein
MKEEIMRLIGKHVVGLMLLAGLGTINACSSQGDFEDDATLAQASDELRRPRVPCVSSDTCRTGEFCTTELGACHRPPGCRRGEICPAVCYGVCRPDPKPVTCGAVTCERGERCCNESCGICTRPGGACTEQLCEPPVECRRDADCRAFSDYCTGCDCRALAASEPDPVCPGPGVQCFVDPCFNQRASCVDGQCELVTAP